MIFRSYLADLVMAGVKTETRRALSDNPRSPWWRERCALVVGERYAVQPGRGAPAVCRLVVEAVDKVKLGQITHDGAVAEGCSDVRDFMHTWKTINGAWDPHAEVWRIVFHAEHLPL